MNKITVILILLCSISLNSCFLDPCNSKNSFLTHLEKTVDEAVENGKEMTEEQWINKDKELEKLMDECYEKFKNELTSEEKKIIFKKSAKYVYVRQKDKFKDLYTIIEDMNLEEEAQKFIALADKELKEIFNDVLKEDVEGFIDDAVNELEKVAEELKKAWEETKKK